jgi:hypothetical protein
MHRDQSSSALQYALSEPNRIGPEIPIEGKSMRITTTHLHAAASVLALLLTSSSVSAHQESPEPKHLQSSIEGSWIFTIDRINQGFTFTALQSFTAGGVTLATGSIDRTPPPPISPLYGSWEKLESHSFAATIYFFAFDLAGNAVAMIKTNLLLHLESRNALVGSGEGFECDLQGEHCVRVPVVDIQIKGKRIIPEKIEE